ncbi:hypothetical protein EWM64_g4386 [Hericium alpestre]|uniref:Mannose-P-dolichol utilization defect 1 protein homolog n=1 Tax=Hericium alpestre TaxID=135208 RepID=A0A4Y9ZXU4_9AGAM|nr:hypothetical protein EWM64_g4386 [Hericium alpestre]
MTTITRNLPWFVKDLGVYIVGEKCYVSLVENLNIEDVECLKYSLSKGLGIGIVVGGSIMKVPQLLLILNGRSASGLSLPAYVLETLAYAITTAYSWRNGFPFSTYGENFFLTIQNIVITLLIIYYSPAQRAMTSAPNKSGQLLGMTFFLLAGSFALFFTPPPALALLQLGTLPLSLFSKLPQIAQNQRARSTGQLSVFAILAQIGGCAARLFTTSQEVGDIVLSAGFALALLLNLVLGLQLWGYWGKDAEAGLQSHHVHVSEEKTAEKEQYRPESRVDIVVLPQSPTPYATSAQQSGSYGRKWARKVD